jgi:hypothetical protein
VVEEVVILMVDNILRVRAVAASDGKIILVLLQDNLTLSMSVEAGLLDRQAETVILLMQQQSKVVAAPLVEPVVVM